MLFAISEWETSDPLPSQGRAEESQPQWENRTHSNSTISRAVQESLKGCSCPLSTQSSSCSIPGTSLAHQPAADGGTEGTATAKFLLTWISALLCFTRAWELSCQHRSRAPRGGSWGISRWPCNQNEPHFLQLPPETGEKTRFLERGLRAQTPAIL